MTRDELTFRPTRVTREHRWYVEEPHPEILLTSGYGPCRPRPLDPTHELLVQELQVDQPRPIRPLQRSRVGRSHPMQSPAHRSCALQYIMLHLSGYKVSMDDLKQFRQIGSITPGHPENGVTDGIEVTTGPLGQGRHWRYFHVYELTSGIANAVGLAIGQAHMGATFNKDGFSLVDNYTFGESLETFQNDRLRQSSSVTVVSRRVSLPRPALWPGELILLLPCEANNSHLKLGNLVAIYDDNSASCSMSRYCAKPQRSPLTVTQRSPSPRTSRCDSSLTAGMSFTSRTVTSEFLATSPVKRDDVTDNSDYDAIENAITEAKKSTNAPTIINLKTTIGFGSQKQGGHDVHGAREWIH